MIGTRIGSYVVVSLLGQGGMGAVYLAVHERLGTKKVVKVLLPQFAWHPEIVRRFENEAMAAARLNHRNIITVDDLGQLPDGQWYILMPYLEGGSLASFLQTHGRLTPHRALHILGQICAALEAAHRAGIVHRDLKPQNVHLTQTEDNPQLVRLLDFGICKLKEDGIDGHTRTGAVFGTPQYMAPEQSQDSKHVDARTDIWSLGAIAYEMLTGTRPFEAESDMVIYHKQVTERPSPPTGVPQSCADTTMSALAVRPDNRPQTAQAFAIGFAADIAPEPPFEPSGAEILALVARELVTNVPANIETVKHVGTPPAGVWPGASWNVSGSGRVAPIGGVPSAPVPAPPSASPATVGARPAASRRSPRSSRPRSAARAA